MAAYIAHVDTWFRDDRWTATRFENTGGGYVHLFEAATLEDLDTLAIPEAMDPAYASGFGDLSVYEVATDPTDSSLAYLAITPVGSAPFRSSASIRLTIPPVSWLKWVATSTRRETTSGASRSSPTQPIQAKY